MTPEQFEELKERIDRLNEEFERSRRADPLFDLHMAQELRAAREAEIGPTGVIGVGRRTPNELMADRARSDLIMQLMQKYPGFDPGVDSWWFWVEAKERAEGHATTRRVLRAINEMAKVMNPAYHPYYEQIVAPSRYGGRRQVIMGPPVPGGRGLR